MADEIILNSQRESDTRRIGRRLAGVLSPGDVVCLLGALGAGKSVMARAIIRQIGNDPEMDVPSPTFSFVQCYDDIDPPIHHYDLYRLDKPNADSDNENKKNTEAEVMELGWEYSIDNAIILVEWPDRLGDLRPGTRLDVLIDHTPDDDNDDQRQIRLFGHGGDWMARINDLFGDIE